MEETEKRRTQKKTECIDWGRDAQTPITAKKETRKDILVKNALESKAAFMWENKMMCQIELAYRRNVQTRNIYKVCVLSFLALIN